MGNWVQLAGATLLAWEHPFSMVLDKPTCTDTTAPNGWRNRS